MDKCLGDDCMKIKEVQSSLKGKVSLSTLALVAGVVTICIGSVVAVYGYVVQDSLSRVMAKESQIVANTVLASENKIEIINLKRSLLTKDEFKSIVKEAFLDVTTP
jgi:GH24 family phage-related lysozyme (muramidase)